MKKQTKKKIATTLFIGIFIISFLFFLSNNALGSTANDEDTQATLHCELKTNSLELTGSNLMGTGTHSFWEAPELDISLMTHDVTLINVNNLQHPSYNNTAPSYYNKNDGLIGNFTVNSSEIQEYILSAGFDTQLSINISYTRNYSYFSYHSLYNIGGLGGNDDPFGLCWDGTYFYVLDLYDANVYKYPSDFSSLLSTYNIGGLGANDDPAGITWNGTYFYVTDYIDGKVYKYPSDFSSLLSTYNIGGLGPNDDPAGITWDGTYFYILDYYDGKVYKYPSDFSSLTTSYNIDSSYGSGLSFPFGLTYDGNYFYAVDDPHNRILKYPSDFSSLIDTYAISINHPRGISWDENYFYVTDFVGGKVYKYYANGSLFDNVYVMNFTYQKLGVDYYENYKLIYDSENSNFNESSTSGFVIYYFDSSFFTQYGYINDITIPQQNLSLIINLQIPNTEINMTLVVSYSTCEWRVPTEVDLCVNSETVIDETYNSGFVSLDSFPTSLVITATEPVFFRLNITIDFSFQFSLSVISKTYLKKSFELESDHKIEIERMDFNDNLNIKKIYLNNIDLGSSNPCYTSVSMDTGNIFVLEVILVEEIYLPLQYLYNHLGAGTSNIYMSGISNTLTYSNINGNHLYSIILPSDWNSEYGQFTFSNLDYLPDYTPNFSNDESGSGYGSSSYGNEFVDWMQSYYQTTQNGSFLEDSGGSGYESVWSEYFNALNGYMSHTYGDLDGYNSTYTVNDYLYMQNLFPTEFKYEDWLSWVHDYNSSYISSTWDNSGVNLTSILNTGSDSSVPLNTSFSFVNGTHTQNGSLWDIDGDYSIDQADFNFNDTSLYWIYTGVSFSVAGQDTAPQGMIRNGSYYYMLGNSNDKVFVYYDNFTYTGTSHDISGQTTTGQSLASNGTHFFISSNGGDEIVVYNSNWNYIRSHSISGQDETPRGIAWNGTHFFMAGNDNDKIFLYNSTWDYQGISYDISGQSTTPQGIMWNGTHFYLCELDHSYVLVYNLDWSYTGIYYDISEQDLAPMHVFDNSTHWFVVGKEYDTAFMYYKYINISRLNFTSQFTFSTQGFYSNNTIESMLLFYSYKTNDSIKISFSIWNYDSSKWDLINESINSDNFFNFNFSLNSSYYDGTNTIKLKFEGNKTWTDIADFELYIDRLMTEVNWTKTSGEIYATITKDIDFAFLDRYDSYSDYQKLYNVTIEILYRYSNYTEYSEFAEYMYDGNNYTLIKDENWHTISLNFEFNSTNLSNFTILFNITNGLLELNTNLNYSIFFKALLNSSYYDGFPDNFNYEPVGESVPNIAWVDSYDLPNACTAQIINEFDNHKNVLELAHDGVSGTPKLTHNFGQLITGTIEFYWGCNDISLSSYVKISYALTGIQLRIYNGKYQYQDNVGIWHDCTAIPANKKLDHHKIVFDCDTDTFDWYINQELQFDDALFKTPANNLYLFHLQCVSIHTDNIVYLDAWGIVSDPKYYEGGNLRQRTSLYQYFKYVPNLNLDYLQETRGSWILNFTYTFVESSDTNLYNFFNSINHSLLLFNISIEHEDGWHSICYNYDTTQTDIDFSLNITQILNGLGKTKFLDFYIEFYLSGNPSNLTLDNLTLFDFDSDFYEVSALWITDTVMISHQEFICYWKASDRHIDRVEITELYDSNLNLLYNITLINNTLQSQLWYNISIGFYKLNFTFYDNYSNWEKWTLNFTLIPIISISTAYKNPCLINENNTISVYINTEYSILNIYYDNSTDFIHQYDNSSYPIYGYEFNFSLSYSVETVYNISILVIGEYNDSFWCNITNLSFIQRTTMLDINNLYSSYYQDEQMNVTFVLKDLYNTPVPNKLLNYTIEAPNGTYIVNSSGTTNSYGNITYNLSFHTAFSTGFYHLNVSFTGDNNYISVWKLQSFQVRPILRNVNSTDINLTVNNHPVLNNFIQVNWTNNFTLANNNTATFDMSISLKLNYTENITYSKYLDYSYTFSSSSDIISLTFDTANLTNYPINYTDYYYDDLVSTNHNEFNNTFQILDIVGDTFYNNDDFSILFTYIDTSQIDRIQLTEEPRTDSNNVQFREYLTANRTFSYWYFHNSLNITTISLNHNRTGATISNSSFTHENNNYYFEKSCLSGDLFTTTTTYWIDWDSYVKYEILTQNGTYSEIEITYQGPFDMSNVTIVIDLNADNLYAENWSHNGVQNLNTFILEIPHINFTTSQQTITITGNSSIPYSTFDHFENEESYEFNEDNYDDDDNNVWYRGYLDFPYYSQAFIIKGRNTTWTLDGVHYSGDEYDITTTGYFECSGFGSGISSAYLRFKAHPIGDIGRHVNYKHDYTVITYRINTILEIQNAEFEFYIENDEAYTIIDILFEGDEVDNDEYEQVKLMKLDEKDHYLLLNLDFGRGVNKIHIKYREDKLENNAGQLILVVIALSFLGLSAWRFSVISKITKEAKEREEKLKRKDLIFLFIFMPHRISNEKVKRRLEKRKKQGKPIRRSWEELKEEAKELKEEARKLKLKKAKEKAEEKAKKKEKKKRKKKVKKWV
ncbi:MAG: hypothetical protein ACFFDN_00185 [Candidatus Hodarchaeota archaeon]